MNSSPILLLSAGMTDPKKTDNPIARLHLYLNYGLLGLATVLEGHGHSPIVLHGRFASPEETVRRLVSDGLLPSDQPVLLSVPSSFALPWARQACALIREVAPTTRIVVGGRWVVADDEPWIRAQLPDAHRFIPGLAERTIADIVAPGIADVRFSLTRPPTSSSVDIPPLNYLLLDGWREFQPSLEVSRGCGMHCTFCAEAEEPLGTMKDPVRLVEEFRALIDLYQTKAIHPYLEASFFRPTSNWCESFHRAIVAKDAALEWRAETRVDGISLRQIRELALAGLRVLDLGLESASPRQLRRMRKSDHPDTYLRRASDLLNLCKSLNIWTKVNVLLHPGETHDTIRETEDWLERHRDAIKGLSVGPTILFRYGQSTTQLLREFEEHGAAESEPGALDNKGYAHLHLSKEIPHELAIATAGRIARSFMSARDYYDLKSFSYLPRTCTWDDFRALVAAHPSRDYSFRTEE